MQFAGERPLQYWYVPHFNDISDPFVDLQDQLGHHGLDYEVDSRFLYDKGAVSGPDDIYYHCSEQFLRNVEKSGM